MWLEERNKLRRDFIFKDFKAAFSFMTEVAAVAEKLNHHPDWCNSYNKVSITLCTHTAGDIITKQDYELATAIDHIAAAVNSQ
ncbi:MAG: pterin-4-alpha-carbinolamine dehydratase [Cytophagales bacterium CG18_big_fil_WC_8_21_14_2_50_42_9]|nr:MAG: pterin-4-alpha-carbinolamine dehydratase [Cytophagales bacterium CG18_big_fil_WC_8_21_14_2_50_42_9]